MDEQPLPRPPSVDEEIERLPLTKAFLETYTLAFDAKMYDADNRMRPTLNVSVVERNADDPLATKRPLLLLHFATVEDATGMKLEFRDAKGDVLFSIDETADSLQDADVFPVLNLGWGMEADSVFAMRAYLMVNQTMNLMLAAGDAAARTGQDAQDVFEYMAANVMRGNRRVVTVAHIDDSGEQSPSPSDPAQPTGGST